MTGSVTAVFQPKFGNAQGKPAVVPVVNSVQATSANFKLPTVVLFLIVYQNFKMVFICALRSLSFQPPSNLVVARISPARLQHARTAQ
jgi:hypothetical protein